MELTYPTLGSSENHRLKMPFLGDMLVPWRVPFSFLFLGDAMAVGSSRGKSSRVYHDFSS